MAAFPAGYSSSEKGVAKVHGMAGGIMEESECDGQICRILWNCGFSILSVYELPGRSIVGDSVLADGNVDAAGSGDRVFYDLPHVAMEELDPGAGTAGVCGCFFSGICEQVLPASGGSGVREPFLYLDDREYQLVLRVSGDDIVRGSLSAVADGGENDLEKAVADGICDDRIRLVGDSGKQQRHCNFRGGHVCIIRDVREGQCPDGSILAGDDDVFRSVSDYLCSPPVEYIFPGTDPGRNYRSADVYDCRHIYDDSVGNYFVLDTQNPGKTKLSGENVT